MNIYPLKFKEVNVLTWKQLAEKISKFSEYQLFCPVVVELPNGQPFFGSLKICDENHPTLDDLDPVIILEL